MKQLAAFIKCLHIERRSEVFKMDLIGSLLTFVMFWKLSSSLQCYSCDGKCPDDFNETVREKYLVNCERSTMCYKRVGTLDFGNGLTSQYTERGCAAQTQDGEQIKVNRKWVAVQNIYEVYKEGCAVDESYPERRTHILDCYCRGDRCNGGVYKLFASLIGVLTISILILILT